MDPNKRLGVFVTILFVQMIFSHLCLAKQEIEDPVSGTCDSDGCTTVTDELKSLRKTYQHAAVQSASDKCSQIGMDIMKTKKGSAVDAAIATLLCIGVVNFPYAGIGGGHLMTVYQAPRGSDKKELITILARETSVVNKDFFKTNSAVFGGTAVGVPGEVMGLYTAWQRFGRVPWQQLVAPSIKLAEDGFVIRDVITIGINYMDIRNWLTEDSREFFRKPDGEMYKPGDIMKLPKMARTLRIIADDPLSFYTGELADDIVADIQDAGGVITKEDMLAYKCRIKEPVQGRLTSLNLTMYSPPPPSSGVILQLILRLIDGLGINESSLKDTETAVDTYHKLVESWKFGYAKRTLLGDVDFDNKDLLANLTDSTYIDEIRSKIDQRSTRDVHYYGPEFDNPRDAGTAHVNVLAPDGSAVAITASLNLLLGAQFFGKRTGIFFNNGMDDFSVPGTVNSFGYSASPANYPEPGKSSMSSMSPTIMLTDDGQVAMVFGAANGSIIISAMSNVAFHNLYLNMDLDQATSKLRLHHQLMPDFIMAEQGFDQEIIAGLKAKGHKFGPEGDNGIVGVIRNQCILSHTQESQDCIEVISDYRLVGQLPSGF